MVGSERIEIVPGKKATDAHGRSANCWECKKCGREPGGVNEDLLGVCPAATESNFTGKNRGINGGRFCWRVAGTFCLGAVQGTYATKLMACSFCDFYHMVQIQEGDELQL